MKKKSLLVLISTLLSFNCISCSNKQDPLKSDNSIKIDQIDSIDSFIKIDENELYSLINKKKDFVLVIGQEGCLSCESIIPVLKSYISNYDFVFYWIDISSYQEAVKILKDDETYSLKPVVMSASLLLFDEGKDVEYIEYDMKLYESKDSVGKKLNKYISRSGYYLINDLVEISYSEGVNMYQNNIESYENLKDLIYDKKEEVTVLFSWYQCPDCQLLKSLVLDDYLKTTIKPLYFFEVDGIRNSSEDEWVIFKSYFQFDDYRDGRVPTFVHFKDGKKVDMAVFVNDVIEEEDNEFVITESFWEDKIVGLKASTKEELYNKSAKEEAKYIKEYLNKYLK